MKFIKVTFYHNGNETYINALHIRNFTRSLDKSCTVIGFSFSYDNPRTAYSIEVKEDVHTLLELLK
jgi:hypothetical protein